MAVYFLGEADRVGGGVVGETLLGGAGEGAPSRRLGVSDDSGCERERA